MTSLIVPVIDVHNENFSELWPSMLLALKTSTFIALDTELSGLGARKSLLNPCVEERYKAICSAARTRSILSLGLACFKELPEKGENAYLSQIFNLTLLCMEDYIIEPQSVQFLVQHGFDFNKQYSQGIPYYKGNDKGNEHHEMSVRTFFLELLRAKKPLILHNGLIDLAFLYQCFYAQLPDNLGNFIADLSEMFPAGIYDTKYASEFEIRITASYLEYAYKKCKRENRRLMDSNGKHMAIEFCNYPSSMSTFVDYRHCSLPEPNQADSESMQHHVCEQFSAYGWCPNGLKCTQSHNIDLIIDEDEKFKDNKKKRNRRKRKKNVEQHPVEETKIAEQNPCIVCDEEPPLKQSCAHPESSQTAAEQKCQIVEQCDQLQTTDSRMEEDLPPAASPQEQVKDHMATEKSPIAVETSMALADTGYNKAVFNVKSSTLGSQVNNESGTHRAGFDAFMTGYIIGYVWMLKKEPGSNSLTSCCLPDCHNKVYLSGKNVPLQIVKSIFSKSSRAHIQKMRLVFFNSS
ncbi:target of EGR1 1 [Pelobates cultripes]|uniref:Target of EGR1 protein 1 n=1 Tax=Pelobates cultripes TaxID=61616 RepID=A0AAD1SUE7_PELCU|nr:target of EGR1 1 [Pelobates cultripes]